MEPNETSVDKVQQVNHADVVHHADVADEVSHADRVGVVSLQGEPLRTNATRRRQYVRDIARSLTVIFALLVVVVVIWDKNNNENRLEDQLTSLTNERKASDALATKKLECQRRFQDAIDSTTETQLVLMGEFLVAITQIPPGPDREVAVKDKIRDLDTTNQSARKAINDKIAYNNAGNPLPCPLTESAPIPESRPSVTVLPTTTTTA